jgi:hypothetical protein
MYLSVSIKDIMYIVYFVTIYLILDHGFKTHYIRRL